MEAVLQAGAILGTWCSIGFGLANSPQLNCTTLQCLERPYSALVKLEKKFCLKPQPNRYGTRGLLSKYPATHPLTLMQLTLRTLSSSRSSYAFFAFPFEFFESFSTPTLSPDTNGAITCKLLAKVFGIVTATPWSFLTNGHYLYA
jgi:hypothetical protein